MPKVEAIQATQKAEYETEQKALNGDAEAAEEAAIDIEPKEEITFDDFMKMQFQVGEIIACEAVAKIQETALLTGKDRKPGKTDRIRNPQGIIHRKRWLARKLWYL